MTIETTVFIVRIIRKPLWLAKQQMQQKNEETTNKHNLITMPTPKQSLQIYKRVIFELLIIVTNVVGSSRNITVGLFISSSAIDNRFFCPPDNRFACVF